MNDQPPDPDEVWVTTEPVNAKPRRRNPFWPITPGAAHAFVFLSVLTLLLAGAAYFFSVRAVQGEAKARAAEVRSRASVVQLCQAGNELRVQQIILWTHIVQISPPPPRETAAQRQKRQAATRQFLAYIRQVFKPRTCPAR